MIQCCLACTCPQTGTLIKHVTFRKDLIMWTQVNTLFHENSQASQYGIIKTFLTKFKVDLLIQAQVIKVQHL